MKVVSSLRRICPDCYFVRRGKKLYMRCTTSPRHKRRQGFSTLLYTGAGAGKETEPMNGLGGLEADTAEVVELEEDSQEEHIGCHFCSKPLNLAEVLAIQQKFKDTFGDK